MQCGRAIILQPKKYGIPDVIGEQYAITAVQLFLQVQHTVLTHLAIGSITTPVSISAQRSVITGITVQLSTQLTAQLPVMTGILQVSTKSIRTVILVHRQSVL